jgi:hypothetical protein
MEELFPYNDSKEAYNFFKIFLYDNYHIDNIYGNVKKTSLKIIFEYNALEVEITINHFNSNGFNNLHFEFSPFMEYEDYTSYRLYGWEINLPNLKRLLKICKYYNIPKCEKCGKYPIEYFEEAIRKTSYSTDLTGNPYLYKLCWDDYFFIPVKVTAECICGNKWILKRVISSSQIKNKSIFGGYFPDCINRNHTKVHTQKEIDELLTQPIEYAKIENTKRCFRRRVGVTKKEMNQIPKAINAGEKDAN